MKHNKVGWLKWHRKLQFNELYLEKPFDRWHAWEHIVINASIDRHIDEDGLVVLPGQLPVGERDLAEEFGWTRTKVRTFLRALKRTGMITTEQTRKGTIITIVNWEKYQYGQPTESTTKSTTNQPTKSTANRTTESTIYKNNKNIEEGEEVCRSARSSSTPSLDDVRDYCRERGFAHVDAEKFWNYYESKNWMESAQLIGWRQRLAYWEAKDMAKEEKTSKKKPISADEINDIAKSVFERRSVK